MRLGDLVRVFKSLTTHRYIKGTAESGWPPFDRRLWQRNYYEHIIRDETALLRLQEYILDNPLHWTADQLHPDSLSKW